jgi:hypothetical protein
MGVYQGVPPPAGETEGAGIDRLRGAAWAAARVLMPLSARGMDEAEEEADADVGSTWLLGCRMSAGRETSGGCISPGERLRSIGKVAAPMRRKIAG